MILNEKGFSLIEVVIALAVLSIGILAMFSMQTVGIKGNVSANRVTAKSTWAADRIEQLLGLDYADAALADTDLDGTNQDTIDENGLDDDGGNFGLDDATQTTADNFVVSPDGQYTIFWNVAVDLPFKNNKTIRVIVLQTGQPTVEFDYIKDKIL